MGIKEQIDRMRGFEIDHTPDGWPAIRMCEVSALCDALLAQQVVIEQMYDSLMSYCPSPQGTERFKQHIAARNAKPDLSALREHEASVVEDCYFAVRGASLSLDGVALTSTQLLSIYDQLSAPLRCRVEQLRKGE